MKLKGFSALASAIVLLVGLIIFEVVLFKATDDLWLGYRSSLLVAMLANLGLGSVATLFSWAYAFLSSKDSNDHILLFGVKAGLAVFLLLAVISVGLFLFKKPPTYAPCGLVVCTFQGLEIASCLLEAVGLIWEVVRFFYEALRGSFSWCGSIFRRRSRGRSAPTGPHPPPGP